MSKDHGVRNGRNELCDGFGFHTLLPKADHFCDGCRPAPNDSRLKAAEKWWAKNKKIPMPKRGTKEWRAALDEWADKVEG